MEKVIVVEDILNILQPCEEVTIYSDSIGVLCKGMADELSLELDWQTLGEPVEVMTAYDFQDICIIVK